MEDRAVNVTGALLEQRYRVDALLARGGMSSVYRGLDTRLDRPVAIKVMDPRFASDKAFVERFEREARSAARIHHPNVVAVHDQGLDGDHVYLVMELVDGGTLRDLISERGALGVPLALSIMEPVLAALAAAHQAGLIHRDVKPENVLIGTGGAVKVADFGLVRAVASVGTTSSSVILGTVAYLSPEQVTTGTATSRGDVYSAGVLLYEMLTGLPPYVGDNALSIAYRHVNDDVPPPSAALPQLFTPSAAVPPALDDLVLRATRREPSARPVDGGAFLLDLQRLRVALAVPRVPVPVPNHVPVERTVPVSAESQALALGVSPPSDAESTVVELAPAATVDAPAVAVHNATVVRQVHSGFQAMGPQGTRAMLRTDALAEGRLPVLTEPPPPSPPYGNQPPYHPPVARPAPRPPRPPRPPSPTRRIVVWSIVAALVLAFAGTTTWWFASGRWTDVPQLNGLAAADAEGLLTGADLNPNVTRVRDNDIESGKVIRSEPAAGARALRGDQVTLVVSMGKPRVPDVPAGTTVDDAEKAIRAEELQPHRDDGKNEFSDSVPKGQVVRLDPAPGTQLNIGQPVTVVRSNGPAPKPVPEVRGRTRDEAFQALQQAGFEPYDAPPEFAGDVEAGRVVRTNPAANTQIKNTDSKRVGVVVSNAITVPDLNQKLVSEAKGILEGLGLKAEVTQFPGFDGRVFTQSPAPGTKVQPGSTVALFAV